MPARLSLWLDRTGLTLSGLCLVHCLAGTLLLSAAAVGGGFVGEAAGGRFAASPWLGHNVHVWGLALALPVAALALWRGAARHGRWAVAAVGATGLTLMALSLAVGHGSWELPLSVTGVALLATAHLANLRATRGGC